MARDDQLYYIACGRRMKRSTGQQLKMVPLGDQQPFPLQLGKLHRHSGTLHAEKIRQLLQISRSYVSRLETHALDQLRKGWLQESSVE